MKKNFTMRTGIIVLALLLATSCLVAGTFAKYVMSVTGADEARVAYFWFGSDAIQTNEFDLFSLADINEEDLDASGANDVVVAPGTGSMIDFEFTGTAEVDTYVDFDLALENLNNIPLVFKYDGLYYSDYFYGNDAFAQGAGYAAYMQDADLQLTEQTDLAGTVEVNAAIAITGDLNAMADAMNFEVIALTWIEDAQYKINNGISWFWAYTNGGNDNSDLVANDAIDTALGIAAYNAIIGADGTEAPDCKLTVTATFTQID